MGSDCVACDCVCHTCCTHVVINCALAVMCTKCCYRFSLKINRWPSFGCMHLPCFIIPIHLPSSTSCVYQHFSHALFLPLIYTFPLFPDLANWASWVKSVPVSGECWSALLGPRGKSPLWPPVSSQSLNDERNDIPSL